jgi:urea carboxylase-associated protein 2
MSSPTSGQTATTSGARDHARAQAEIVAPHIPTVPDGVDAARLVWTETIPAGGYAHKAVAAGTTIRLSDPEADACAHLLLFRSDQPWERLNVADTVKIQWQAYTAVGQQLLSDQARVLATVVGDTSGRHDAICGTSSRLHNEERYGSGSPEGYSPAGRELFVLGAAKHGLSPRDLPPSLSFFKGVRVEPSTGRLLWQGGCGSPAIVDLRAELPLIVLLANTTHPLDPADRWHASTLGITAWSGDPTGPSDPAWTSSPERERAYLNTVDDRVARGIR